MRIIFALFKAYPGRTLAMLTAIMLAGLAEGFGLATLLPLLAGVVGKGADGVSAADNRAGRMVLEVLHGLGLEARPSTLLTIVVIAIILKCVLVLLSKREVGYAVAHVATDLRLKLIRALLAARWEYFVRQPVGGLANAVATEAMRASQAYLSAANTVAVAFQAVIYIGVALLISWPITLISLAASLLLLTLLHRLVRKSRRAGDRQTTLLQLLLRHLTDSLQSIKPLKAMAREDRADGILVKETDRLNHALRKQVFSKAALKALQEPLVTLVMIIGLFVALEVFRMAMAEVMVLVFLLARSLKQLGLVQQHFQKMVIFESAYWSLLGKIEEARRETETHAGSRVPRLERELVFDKVSFSYGDIRVLDRVSFRCEAGSFTALIGPSGAGKTTILDLVAGLRSAQDGNLRIDGIAFEEIDIRVWRRQIGYVPQEPLLLNDSVMTNITLGDPGISESMVIEALRAAGALEFVEALPGRLAAGVGERGEKLSGGQRQRLAIARALVGAPRLLLLDEATSALDPESEAAICRTLEKLKGRLTIIAVSHQTALVEAADQALRLADGSLRPFIREGKE